MSNKTTASYNDTRYNALKHGILSKIVILPWEKEDDLLTLQQQLIDEYRPQGITEQHLVIELSNVMLRKQRLNIAEKALIVQNMSRDNNNYHLKESANLLTSDTVPQNYYGHKSLKVCLYDQPDKNQDEIAMWQDYIALAEKLIADDHISYENMLSQCPSEIIDGWQEYLQDYSTDRADSKANAKSFKSFLQSNIIAHCIDKIDELQSRKYIKEQMIGLSYIPNETTDKLLRYEAALDRKFEKTLAMLIKLQDIRKSKITATEINLIEQPQQQYI